MFPMVYNTLLEDDAGITKRALCFPPMKALA